MAPNTRSYNALLSACERAEQPDRALEVLLNMKRRAPDAWGYIDPNAVTYNTVMSATARAGRCVFCCLNDLSWQSFDVLRVLTPAQIARGHLQDRYCRTGTAGDYEQPGDSHTCAVAVLRR